MASFSTSCSINLATFALLFVIVASEQTSTSIGDFLSPLLSPIFENVCKEVGCGKGKCKPSENGTFPFECVCDEGWKQPLADQIEGFKFLPCVIPNCSIDYSCSAAPPSSAVPPQNTTKGPFDPCRSNFCGGGTCKKNSSSSTSSSTSSSFSSSYSSSYSCSCSEGYNNIFNSTSFPCLRECSLGSDCQKLGISMFNRSNASSPSAVNVNNDNEARSLQGKLNCVIVLIGLVSVVFSI